MASDNAPSAASLLVVILEASEAFLRSTTSEDPTQRLPMTQCFNDLTTFVNSYMLLSRLNRICVCLCHQAGCDIVYPVPGRDEVAPEDPRLLSGKYEPLVHVNATMNEEVQRIMGGLAASPPSQVSSSCLLSGALSKCLCYIHRAERETAVGEQLNARILVIRSSEDAASQYVAIMNCIFAAQKQNVPIDSCVLWNDSGFLQQASDITGGVYVKVPEPSGLLEFLLWVFLPDSSARSHLSLPPAVQVDFRAACFCHHKLVEVGYVCSVCLAIFCQFTPICSICQTHFKRPSLAPLRTGKKKKNHRTTTNPR